MNVRALSLLCAAVVCLAGSRGFAFDEPPKKDESKKEEPKKAEKKAQFQPGTYAPTRHRDEVPHYSRDAFGDIYTCRFVTLIYPGQVRQSIVGDLPYGVSGEETRGSPYREMLGQNDVRAAADGEPVFIYGPPASDVCLSLGGPVQIGQRLTTDYVGRGILATTGQWVLAIAEEPGAIGETRKVNLIEPQRMR